MSQCKAILRHLKRYPLTSLDALRLFGVLRLAARIGDLKQQGHAIESRMIEVTAGKRVAQYRLVKP